MRSIARASRRTLIGIAAAAATLATLTPAASAFPVAGLYRGPLGDAILRFDSTAPNVILTTKDVSGLASGERLVALEYRTNPVAPPAPSTAPADPPGLYGLGVAATTGAAHLYRVDASTGAAAAVGSGFTLPVAPDYGLGYDAAIDRFRVVTSLDDNLRLNPSSGTLAATDTDLTPAGHHISALTYNVTDAPGGPVAFLIDPTTDHLLSLGGPGGSPSPNGGTTTDIGPLGVDVPLSHVGFDMGQEGTLGGQALVTFGAADGTKIYGLNTSSGAVTLVGAIPVDLLSIAALPGTVQFSATSYVTSETSNATVTVVRNASAAPATVTVATSGGTADPASDYTPLSTVLTFAPGEASKTIDVGLKDDKVHEDAETIGLTLSAPSGIALGDPSAATITINDNDPLPAAADTTPPVVTIASVSPGYKQSTFRKAGITVKVTTNEPAKVEASLSAKLKKATAARALAGTYNLELTGKALALGSGTRTIKLKPKSALFGKPKKSVKVQLRVLVTDAAGNATAVTKVITVKR